MEQIFNRVTSVFFNLGLIFLCMYLCDSLGQKKTEIGPVLREGETGLESIPFDFIVFVSLCFCATLVF